MVFSQFRRKLGTHLFPSTGRPNNVIVREVAFILITLVSCHKCNLFGRRYLSDGFSKETEIKNLASQYPSMIVLPPLPEKAREVLIAHDRDILEIFQGYAGIFAAQIGLVDNALPLSHIPIGKLSDAHEIQSSVFYRHLNDSAIRFVVFIYSCSPGITE